MKKFAFSSLVFLALLVVGAVLLLEARTPQASRISSHNLGSSSGNDNEWTWQWSQDNVHLELRNIGERDQLVFTEDYSDIMRLSPNGFLRLRDRRDGVEREYEIRADSAGNLQRSYRVNGRLHDLDGEGRAWFARVLVEAVRESAIDAPARVRRLLQQGGVSAVLAEVLDVKSDYPRRIYLSELLKSSQIDARSVQQVVEIVAMDIHSDYEKSQVLQHVPASYLTDERVAADFVVAADTIQSDYERGRVFAAILRQPKLSRQVISRTLKSIGRMSSDYERARVLNTVSESHFSNVDLNDFFAAVSTIESDYEKNRVLLTVVGSNKLNHEAIAKTIEAARGIGSDYEKARFLVNLAGLTDDATVRQSVLDAAGTIGSDYERKRVLTALSKQ